MRLRTGVILGVATLLAGLASAETLPTTFSSPGFVLLQVESAGFDTTFVEFTMDFNGPAIGFVASYDDGYGAAGGTILWSGGTILGYEMKNEHHNGSLTRQSSGTNGWLSGTSAPEGRHQVLLFAAGSVPSWGFKVTPADTPWEVLAQGPTHAPAMRNASSSRWTSVQAGVAAAYVAEELVIDFTIDHHLIGFFAPDPETLPGFAAFSGAEVSGPDGTTDCPCSFTGAGPTAVPGPGAYQFAWSGVGAQVGRIPLAAWADVPLT